MQTSELYAGARSIVLTLHHAGFQAYLVGGCVRDLVMGAEPVDIDIATSARPEEVTALFPGALLVGAQFGVVIVRHEGHQIEVATFRADHAYEDGRHPTAVTFTDAQGDVRRRDFTINGLLYDPETDTVIDYVGGREDIARKVVRAIGDPEARFAEDRLRMLRAVRFAARLGFEIEPATAQAIRRHAPHITDVSWERIADELERQLVPPTRGRSLRLMDELGLLGPILPEVTALKGIDQGKQFHPEGDAFDHTLLMMDVLRAPLLANVPVEGPEAPFDPRPPTPDTPPWPLVLGSLLHDIGKAPTVAERDGRITFYEHDGVGEQLAGRVCARLRQSRKTTETVTWLVRRHMAFLPIREMRPATLKRLMRQPDFPLLLELYRADTLASGGTTLEPYQHILGAYRDFLAEPKPAAPLITGHDLLALGLAPGPTIGRILRAVEEEQLDGHVKDREAALALARRLAGL